MTETKTFIDRRRAYHFGPQVLSSAAIGLEHHRIKPRLDSRIGYALGDVPQGSRLSMDCALAKAARAYLISRTLCRESSH